MKQIELTQGKYATVDDADYEYLMQWKWYALWGKGKWYAARNAFVDGKRKTVYMHREIVNAPKGMQVDHRDSNGLNNTRRNLRVCTHAQNLRNRGKDKDNTAGFKGIFARKNRYVAKIGVNGKYIYLGTFDTAAQAARIYDLYAQRYHGEFARLNGV